MLDAGGRLSRNNNCDRPNIIGRQNFRRVAAGSAPQRLWDGIRALGYWPRRAEVDLGQLAVTGQSGGGTLSAYLWAMEPRFKAVASSCWCTSYLETSRTPCRPTRSTILPASSPPASTRSISSSPARANPRSCWARSRTSSTTAACAAGYEELRRIHEILGGEPDTCGLSMDVQDARLQRSQSSRDGDLLQPCLRESGTRAPAPAAPPRGGGSDGYPRGRRVPRRKPSDVRARGRTGTPRRCRPRARFARGAARKDRVALKVRVPDAVPHHRRLFQTRSKSAATGHQVSRFVVESDPASAACCATSAAKARLSGSTRRQVPSSTSRTSTASRSWSVAARWPA